MYRDYEFKEDKDMHAHSYLIPVLNRMLSRKEDRMILDLGCGEGSLGRYLIEKGYDLYGVDPSEVGIRIAKKYYPERFYVIDSSMKTLPKELEGIKFNTIVSTEVIEHIYNPRDFISFCQRILLRSGGGELLLSTPYHGYIKNLLLALTGKLDQHFTALWDGGHIKFWSTKTLSILLGEFDFTLEEFKGAGRLPLVWKSMVVRAII